MIKKIPNQQNLKAKVDMTGAFVVLRFASFFKEIPNVFELR